MSSFLEAMTPSVTLPGQDESTALLLVGSLEQYTEEISQFSNLPEQVTSVVDKVRTVINTVKERGVNQKTVNDINQLFPGAIDTTAHPINSFTTDFSQMQLGVALESLDSVKNNIVVKGLIGLFTLIVKAFEFIINAIKSYIGKREELARLGLSVTKAAEDTPDINNKITDVLVKELERRRLIDGCRYGLGWMMSLAGFDNSYQQFKPEVLTEYWEYLPDELEHEFKVLNDSFNKIGSPGWRKPVINTAQQSRTLVMLVSSLPAGVDEKGTPLVDKQIVDDFKKDPSGALFRLGQNLKRMFESKCPGDNMEIVKTCISMGTGMDTYNAVNSLIFDRLADAKFTKRLDKVHKNFRNLYSQVNRQAVNSSHSDQLNEFIMAANNFSVKVNCFNQLSSIMTYVDGNSVDCIKRIAQLTLNAIDISREY